MRNFASAKRMLAVFLAALMTIALIPAQALAEGGKTAASSKIGTGAQREDNSGRIVLDAKLGEPTRLIADHSSQGICVTPDENGAYYGDYIIIFNPDYSDTTGKYTGSLSGKIETTVTEHLDGSGSGSADVLPLAEEEEACCGTAELMERETRMPADDGSEGERISYSAGSTRNFTLGESPIDSDTVNFTCLYVGTHCYIWTPTDKTEPKLLPLDNIDSTYAKTYADEFDSKFDLMKSSFGDHWNSTEGDGKVHLVFYNIKHSSWSGFFWAEDFTNNHVPMINISTNFLRTNPASFLFSTIVHEYQHLIHYSVCHAQNKSDSSWLTEMMSAAAEEICYPGSSVSTRIPHWLGLNATSSNASNPYFERKNELYYAQSGSYGLYAWENLSGFDAVSQYGRASLFAQFLFSHMGGNTIYKTLLNIYANNSSYTCGDAIKALINTYGSSYGYDYANFNRQFWIAMVMNPGPGTTNSAQIMYNAYGFKVQEGYDPAEHFGLQNPYEQLCPLVYTSTSSHVIRGGMALVVKPVNGRFIPPTNAGSGLEYIGVFTNEKLHHDTVEGEIDTTINNYSVYPFVCSGGAAKSSNAGVASSRSGVAYTGTGDLGSVKFSIKVSGEGSGSNIYDGLNVYLIYGGSSYLQLKTASTNGWRDYELTLPNGTTEATISFEYVKDGSVNSGDDCAWIDGIEFVKHADPTLDEALNYYSDIDINFSTSSEYPFYVDYVGEDDVGVSGNAGVANSVSSVSCRVYMDCGDDLEFEYFYSTELNYDFFTFKVNGTEKLKKSGTGSTWTTYTFRAYTAGIYTFEWKYEKDNSTNSGQDCIKLDNVRRIPNAEQPYTVNDSLNVGGGTLSFTTDARPTFGGDYWYDDSIVTAFNVGIANSKASIETTITMYEGDELSFEYYVSSEDGYDWFEFSVDGQSEMRLSGDIGWRYYTYTAPVTGYYTFRWSYTKDNSVNKYMDTVKLDNVQHYKKIPSLNAALNSEYTDLWLNFVSTGTYPFVVNRDNPYALMAESSNGNVDSSYSSMTTSVSLKKGDTISFYYYLSSEDNYDWFDFYVDGTRLVHDSGDVGIQFVSYEVKTTGVHTFVWRYTKDGDRSEGDDIVKISEVRVELAAGLLGDVDGNGKVEATDALLALRMAMGIIETPYDIYVIDVDGNNKVEATDALLILRYAMGIISSF
ncbi:MAG: dockerin type I repeat-containing protein [Clostridiales bacterium]|nr:dockerin type I repeat-containing protein [Clostridiales bacterium]